jgi:hypothetical protein
MLTYFQGRNNNGLCRVDSTWAAWGTFTALYMAVEERNDSLDSKAQKALIAQTTCLYHARAT